MNLRRVLVGAMLALAGAAGCRSSGSSGLPVAERPASVRYVGWRSDTLRFVSNGRPVPVRFYAPANGQLQGLKVALLNHGYGGHYGDYSFLAGNLVEHGYLVVSLQQDLPRDAPLPSTGNIAHARRAVWERGVRSMLTVLEELRRTRPMLDFGHTLLVGHSNGGDMAMLFAQEYPAQVEKVITLDNRRVPLPRRARPQVLTLRSIDQPADAGVLPTADEQARLGIRVVRLLILHDDMWDGATDAQKTEINTCVSKFLEQPVANE